MLALSRAPEWQELAWLGTLAITVYEATLVPINSLDFINLDQNCSFSHGLTISLQIIRNYAFDKPNARICILKCRDMVVRCPHYGKFPLCGPVAQRIERASSESRGRWFESNRGCHASNGQPVTQRLLVESPIDMAEMSRVWLLAYPLRS
jgi:hypothetical protein